MSSKSKSAWRNPKNVHPTNGQNKRFEEACELQRKGAAKFLENVNEIESSSEDELDNSSILQTAFSKYSDNNGNDLTKAREYIEDVIVSGAVVCLICIESVKRSDKSWYCSYCYGILHLQCIQKWAKDSIYHHTSNEEGKKIPTHWSCPKCRSEYPVAKPIKYLCFCGKVENPTFDGWNIPHSCGKTCGKQLKPECSHTCTLLCHPGPCPPCPKTVLTSCCCSKSKPISVRCSNKEWTCGKVCQKPLSCKLHSCEDKCHRGACLSCKKKSKQKCKCGRNARLQPCDNPVWQCEQKCGKPLSCGNHLCSVVCHEGPCSDCPNSGPRLCPCGKTTASLPCTESVSPCGDTCGKLLECELHHCSQRCHLGPCEKCLQMRIMRCRCGQKERSVPCCKEFTCDLKCKSKRDCGKHFCNRKCCIGNCPQCEAPCGKTLNCGRHKCSSICHQGPCFPCRETTSVTCNCGITKITIPCGRERSAVPPRCSANCKLPADCHHPERHKHQCHFGKCPPCRLICGKKLSCGHSCPNKCHSAVFTKIETKQLKAGPWDLINSYKTELVDVPCLPCMVPVPVMCLGGHEIQSMPCHEARPISCGKPCGRKLVCGNHFCPLECHKTSNKESDFLQSKECAPCEEMCSKPRKPGCSHQCTQPCHPGDCKTCQQSIKMKCHCGINLLFLVCSQWVEAEDSDRLLSCSNRCPKQMSCGHRCTLLCHKGDCGSGDECKKKVVLRCPCKRQKKEVQCSRQSKNPVSLECDDECARYQEILRAELLESKLKEEEKEKMQQEKELQEFLRKTEGKKKRKKKNTNDDLKETSYLPLKLIIPASILSVIAVMYYFVLEI